MMQLQEPEARWFFQQLVIGLDYCHSCVSFAYLKQLDAPPKLLRGACDAWKLHDTEQV